VRPPAVKPALQLTNQIGPRAYERWRASRLWSVTEALEQTRILNLIGPVEGRRILDLGCGDGLLTWTLAERGAWAVGIDVDRAMLDVASARSVRSRRQRPRFVEGRIEQLPFPDGSFDVVVIVTVLCLRHPRQRFDGAISSRKHLFQALHDRFKFLRRRTAAQAESDRAHADLWTHAHRLQDG